MSDDIESTPSRPSFTPYPPGPVLSSAPAPVAGDGSSTDLFRFVGHTTTIGIYTISAFGQLIELPKPLARDGVAGGAAIIPDYLFQSVGFTSEELSENPRHEDHAAMERKPDGSYAYVEYADREFMEKKRKVLALLHEYRSTVLSDQEVSA